VEVRVAQVSLHAMQIAELHPLFDEPFRKAWVALQHFATDAFRETGHSDS
jgi:hypothetical protein